MAKLFSIYQIPEEAVSVKTRVSKLEEKLAAKTRDRREGYIDPKTGSFVFASRNSMRNTMRTNPDESIRKACFEALEKLPLDTIDDYIEIVRGRNEYARILGYEDFYDYKIHIDEGMSKDELFSIFDKIYEKTKYAFKNIRDLEKKKPGLRKPWNFGYMMTGDFSKEEDPYFQFENVIDLWGRSFSALGIDYIGGSLKLDLLDRKGKYDNGFCHYPTLVHYRNNKIVPGSSNFTSNAIPGQIGSGIDGIHTVFHEAGHAADRLNSVQKDVCINTEYPPSTVSWLETHSMFLDTISSSIEWKTRYAKDTSGNPYPFEIFEKKMRVLNPIMPLEMMSIIFVMDFERSIYECKNLTKDFVISTAKKVYAKCFDRSEDSISILNIPHIYSWESSAYYHGYGLAELGVHQWREYFFKKYGYIVDNPNIGKEMTKVWKLGSLYKSNKFIKIATGKELSADAFINNVTRTSDEMIAIGKARVDRLKKVPLYIKPVKLNAKISMVDGKKKISDNSKSFENMEQVYKKWIQQQKKTKLST
jgi:oligoendopeptidase F